MMTLEALDNVSAELARRGLPEDYLSSCADVIEGDENGKWIIRDDTGNIIDRIEPLWPDPEREAEAEGGDIED